VQKQQQPTQEIRTYQGADRNNAFVLRTELDPLFDGKDNKRKFRVSALWLYCCHRFQEAWKDEKKKRFVPQNYHGDQGVGWWFPASWVEDFADAPRLAGKVPKRKAKRHFDGPVALSGFPSVKEFRRWGLPPGTIINAADATVTYPNGFTETWVEAKRKSAGTSRAAA
jgi:hypothetical protein